MTTEIIPFAYESKQVRVIRDEHGEPWWVGRDVCEILGLGNPNQAMATHLDEDEKGVHVLDTPGGPQEMTIISESGLYALIMRSNKPQSKPFRKWVTSEVLPSIRKTGRYQAPKSKRVKPQTDDNRYALRAVNTIYKDALSIAKLSGLSGNQAILAADRLTTRLTGQSPVNLIVGTPHLDPEIPGDMDRHLTPTEIGHILGGLSAIKINRILEAKGFQVETRSKKCDLIWKPTPTAMAYAVLKDTGKKNSSGTPVQQLFWKERIVDILRRSINADPVHGSEFKGPVTGGSDTIQ